MQKSVFYFSIFLLLNTSVVNSFSKGLGLSDLPKTCLPEIGRMTDNVNNTCHCPPVEFCNQSLQYKDATHNKLPEFIQDICCPEQGSIPALSLKPIEKLSSIPAGTTNNNTCDVHFFKSSTSLCSTKTQIGPRVANYCSVFSTTNPTYTNSVQYLNQCLENNCKPIHTDILNMGGNFYRKTPKETGLSSDDTVLREIAELKTQLVYKEYSQCRETCFQGANLYDLMPEKEKTLNSWVYKDLTINNKDQDIVSTNFVKRNDLDGFDPVIPHFEYKFYEIDYFTTTNQIYIADYISNTFSSVSMGLSDRDYTKFNDLDTRFDNATNNKHLAESHTSYLEYLYKKGFISLPKKIEQFDNQFNYMSPISDIQCDYFERITSCITNYNSDGSCVSCLAPETLVTLADNTKKPIKDLKAGDNVKTQDNRSAKVVEVVKLEWNTLKLYNINNGLLKITADHPIMTRTGWKAFDYNERKQAYKRYGLQNVAPLKIGDEILNSDSKWIKITDIKHDIVKDNPVTYNLVLEKPHKSFYANNILVKSQQDHKIKNIKK